MEKVYMANVKRERKSGTQMRRSRRNSHSIAMP